MQKSMEAPARHVSGREISVITSPLVTRPTPAVSLPAAQASVNAAHIDGYNLGVDTSQLYQLRIILLSLIEKSADSIFYTEGLPAEWQGIRLKQAFQERDDHPSLDKRLMDACADLAAAAEDYRLTYPGKRAESHAHADQDTWLILAGNAYAGGIRRLLKSDSPSADELRGILTQHGAEKAKRLLNDIRANAPKTGRKSGPTPSIRYILEETRRIRQLHHTHSAGEDGEMLVKTLSQRQDVRHWQEVKTVLKGAELQDALDKETVEVQAFDLLNGLDRAELGGKIQKMRENHRSY